MTNEPVTLSWRTADEIATDLRAIGTPQAVAWANELTRPVVDPSSAAHGLSLILSYCAEVGRLPDTGTHSKGCWKHHNDCFAALIADLARKGLGRDLDC